MKKKIFQEPELKVFVENVDAWIKQIRGEFANFSDIPSIVNENTDNIQYNYEQIYELKDQIEELKQEINSIKLIQIIALKKNGKIDLKKKKEENHPSENLFFWMPRPKGASQKLQI